VLASVAVKCPYCGVLDNKVIDSRLSQGGEVTRRRRECEGCERRYTTYERVEQVMPLVIKRDGRRQPWERMKLVAGLRRAVVKRPVTAEAVENLVESLERNLMDSGEKEVEAAVVGAHVLEALRELDPVAYVRFASVYREFADLDQFVEELKKLRAVPEGSGDDE
jgi:transcriptional repressor NrdR